MSFNGFDDKILALYARGMTTRDIQAQLQELYGVEVSLACQGGKSSENKEMTVFRIYLM